MTHTTTYQRLRMEIGLAEARLPEPELPEGYLWHPWHPALLDRHARVKRASFAGEIDSRVFRSLRDFAGCRKLMRSIVDNEAFFPQATWLIGFDAGRGRPRDCGTIQGLALAGGLGSVQNVGIVPEHRGRGLGRALVLKALRAFRAARLRAAYLEVTADNHLAIDLYRSLGFRLVKTIYKSVEAEPLAV
ncbi:MAG: N-acetyltransferase [Planctomycetales bacterium]